MSDPLAEVSRPERARKGAPSVALDRFPCVSAVQTVVSGFRRGQSAVAVAAAGMLRAALGGHWAGEPGKRMLAQRCRRAGLP